MATLPKAGQGQSMAYEGMGAAIKMVRDGAARQQEVKTTIDNAVNLAGQNWSGQTQAAFYEKYRDYRVTLENFIQALNEYANGMEEHMRKLQEIDRRRL